jgi:L-ascorbate metabolism protein UlaG (beta-lactamase superfamily)
MFRVVVLALLLMAGAAFAPAAFAQQGEVLYLGHSAFRITSPTGRVIVIDPLLRRNPLTPSRYRDLAALGRVDVILATHGHGDHIDDLPELATLTGATVVAPFELGNQLVALGLVDRAKMIAMNKGGTVNPLGPAIKIHMVHAEHSSSIRLGTVKPDEKKGLIDYVETGPAVGFVIEFENGFRIYHTGDTDVFGDMALIHRFFRPDLALVCIGGHYTMDPERAAFAMRELVRPKQVIPIHYGTYPVINRTTAEFRAALGDAPIVMLDVKPGDSVRF